MSIFEYEKLRYIGPAPTQDLCSLWQNTLNE